MKVNCPNCSAEITSDSATVEIVCQKCKTKVNLAEFLSVEFSQTNTKTLDQGAAAIWSKGDKIAQFEIIKELGSGGFGSVYEAQDNRLDRRVAIKFPRMAKMTAKHAQIFIREAQAAAQLNHSNMVSVFEIGHDLDQVYIVSELINGVTLNVWMNEEKPDSIRLSKMLAKIARALEAAHQARVVHRDIKPRNILIDINEEPFIADFGLARRIEPGEVSISRNGQIMGTPAYMSPEQALGKSNEADGRTDIYSLGVILYEGLLGFRPYRGETDVVTEEIVRGYAESPIDVKPKISPDISAVCMKAMARIPGDRYQTALAFAADLESFSQGRETKARPLDGMEKITRFLKRKLVGVIASLVIVGLTSAFFLTPAAEVVYVAQEEEEIHVEFKVRPAEAKVRIVKVDQELGRVEMKNVIFPNAGDQPGDFTANLTKGVYIVEASIDGVGIQEVRRTVEDQPGSRSWEHYNTSWKPTPQGIKWPTIYISQVENDQLDTDNEDEFVVDATETEMVLVEGGRFKVSVMGNMRECDLPDFLLGKHEVTVKEFRAAGGELPAPMVHAYRNRGIKAEDIPDQDSVVNVLYRDVLRFCEVTGTRPMLFDEYLAVATNFGRTKYPWGDEEVDDWQKNWGYDSDEPPKPNVLLDKRFTGFYSGYLEWTQEFQLVTSPTTGIPFGIAGMNRDYRYLADGPGDFIRGYVLQENTTFEASGYTDTLIERESANVGFRVARSLKPRIVKPLVIKKGKPTD